MGILDNVFVKIILGILKKTPKLCMVPSYLEETNIWKTKKATVKGIHNE